MKFTEDEKFELKEMASEYSRLVDKILSQLCELQEASLLKCHYSDGKKLSEEAAKLDGARKLSADFKRFLSDARKSTP